MKILEEVEKKLDNILGKDEKDIWDKLLIESRSQHKDLFEETKDHNKKILLDNADVKTLLLSLIERIQEVNLEIPDKLKVFVENQLKIPKQEFPREIKISNLKEYPTEIDLKKSNWMLKAFNNLFEGLGNIYKQAKDGIQRVQIEPNRKPSQAIPVVLTDKKGTKFVDPFMAIAQGSSGSSYPTATVPQIQTVVMTIADTEYLFTFPKGTKRFTIQNRADNDMRYAYRIGKVAGSNNPYATIKAGQNYYESGLYFGNVTIYFASSTAAQTVEIILYF